MISGERTRKKTGKVQACMELTFQWEFSAWHSQDSNSGLSGLEGIASILSSVELSYFIATRYQHQSSQDSRWENMTNTQETVQVNKTFPACYPCDLRQLFNL